jgi:hypothetical protein
LLLVRKINQNLKYGLNKSSKLYNPDGKGNKFLATNIAPFPNASLEIDS